LFTRRVLQLVPQSQRISSHLAHIHEKQIGVAKNSELTFYPGHLEVMRQHNNLKEAFVYHWEWPMLL